MVTRTPTGRSIAVIGAGLAGAACARVLAKMGERVTVLEMQGGPARGASGNPVGIFHHLFSQDHNLASQWSAKGVSTTRRWMDELSPIADTHGWGRLGHACGVLQLTEDGEDLAHWDAQGGWIKPALFVAACLSDAQFHGAQLHLDTPVDQVDAQGRILLANGRSQVFDLVIVCAAQNIAQLLPDHELGLNQIRGTVTSFQVPPATPKTALPPCVICASGYVTPVIDGELMVGASFERLPDGQPDTVSNLDRLKVIDPRLAILSEQWPCTDRTSIRNATIDRMPLVGCVLDTDQAFTPQMSQLHHLPRNPRLWVLGGLGSRGLTSAPLGAEVLAAQLSGKEPPVSERLCKAIDPARFALRRHQRRAQS